MAGKIKGIIVEIGGDTTGLNKALKIANDGTKSLQSELKQVNAALKFDPQNVDLLAQKQKLLTQAIDDTKAKVTALKQAKEKADKDMANGTEISETQYRKLEREISFAETALKDLETQAKKSKISLDGVGDGVVKAGGEISSVGQSLSPVSAAVAGIGIAAVTMAQQFTDSMAKVSTIADTTQVPMKELESQILGLSDQTGISANLIAEDVYNAISAGQDTADAVNFVTESTKLAKAGFAESSQSLDILTTILNAYGLEAEEVTNVSDMLIQTQNKGKTTVAELSASMGKIIPTAKGQNVALDQLCVSYATMTAKGIATAETTTYLNSMINELGKSGSASAKVLEKETGKSFADLMGEGKSLADVLIILDENAKENGKSMGDMFGSAEASKAALTLLDEGVEGFNEGLIEMNASTGATQEAFDKMQTPAEKLKISLNQIKNAGIKLGNALQPLFEALAKTVEKLAKKISNLTDEQMKTIATIVTIVAVVAPILIIGGKIVTLVGNLAKASKILWTVLAANPIVGLIAAIVGITAVIGVLCGKVYEETEAEKKLREEHEALIKKNQELSDSTKALHEEIANEKTLREDNKEAIENQMGASKILADELYKLADKEELSNGEKARMAALVDELNETIPELNLALNDETGELSLQKDEVDGLIESQEKLLLAKAAQEDLLNIATRQFQVTKSQKGLEDQRENTLNKINTYQKEYNDLVAKNKQNRGTGGSDDVMRGNQLLGMLDELKIELKTTDDSIALNKTSMEGLDAEYQLSSEIIAENSAKVKENAENTWLLAERSRMLSGAIPFNNEAFAELNRRIEENETASDNSTAATERLVIGNHDLTAVLEATGLEAEEVTTKFNTYADMTQNAFGRIDDAVALTREQMIGNLEANTKTVKEWSDNLVLLGEKGIDEGFLKKLREMGPEYDETIKNLAKSTPAQLEELNKAFKEGGEGAMDALLGEFGMARVADSGTQINKDIATKMEESTATTDAAKKLVFTTKKAINENITLCEFDTAGLKITDSITAGLNSGAQSVIDAVASIISRANAAANGGISINTSNGEVKQNSKSKNSSGKIPMFAKGGTLTRGLAIVGEAGPELLQVMNGRTIVKPLSNGEKLNPIQSGGQPSQSSNHDILQALNTLTQAVNRGHVLQADGYTLAKVVREANASNNMLLGV